MKEQLPAPDFDANQYERPNQDWICGRAADGQCCRVGPDPSGHCRATYECRPVLEVKEGESKGRYRCTRTAEFGGPCDAGPLPDGTCSRAIPKCQPVRSLRSKRKVFTRAVVIATAAGLLVALGGPYRARYINPGRLSAAHSNEAFAKMHGGGSNCTACHSAASHGPSHWLGAGVDAKPGMLDFPALFKHGQPQMTAIDEKCEKCHLGRNFHEPDVVRDHSCSACHQEHHGVVMASPASANCLSCHADAKVMEASYEKGLTLAASAFDFRPDNGRAVFKAPRPERGYTELIHSFATDHPEFQVLREKLPDPDTLRFNHQLHLSSPNIPLVNGKKIDCAHCHTPDATGRYYLPVWYERSCKECHSLQFDAKNPGLTVPHGDAAFARAFLRSLPAQYAEFGRKKGLTEQEDLNAFVKEQMTQLRAQAISGENLEQEVFFNSARVGLPEIINGVERAARSRFPGCAFCHDVRGGDDQTTPVVTRPIQMERWLVRGQFDHAKHLNVSCATCHDAANSRLTADVLLPSKNTCADCHSPKGGVANGCSTCHSYHTPAATMAVTQAVPAPIKLAGSGLGGLGN